MRPTAFQLPVVVRCQGCAEQHGARIFAAEGVVHIVFGLILSAIAVEVIANGLRQLFPVLGGT